MSLWVLSRSCWPEGGLQFLLDTYYSFKLWFLVKTVTLICSLSSQPFASEENCRGAVARSSTAHSGRFIFCESLTVLLVHLTNIFVHFLLFSETFHCEKIVDLQCLERETLIVNLLCLMLDSFPETFSWKELARDGLPPRYEHCSFTRGEESNSSLLVFGGGHTTGCYNDLYEHGEWIVPCNSMLYISREFTVFSVALRNALLCQQQTP